MKVRKEVWEKAAIVAATVVVCLVGVVWAQLSHEDLGDSYGVVTVENNSGGTKGSLKLRYILDNPDPHASMRVLTNDVNLLANQFRLDVLDTAFADMDPIGGAGPVGNAGYVLVETNFSKWDLVVSTTNGGFLVKTNPVAGDSMETPIFAPPIPKVTYISTISMDSVSAVARMRMLFLDSANTPGLYTGSRLNDSLTKYCAAPGRPTSTIGPPPAFAPTFGPMNCGALAMINDPNVPPVGKICYLRNNAKDLVKVRVGVGTLGFDNTFLQATDDSSYNIQKVMAALGGTAASGVYNTPPASLINGGSGGSGGIAPESYASLGEFSDLNPANQYDNPKVLFKSVAQKLGAMVTDGVTPDLAGYLLAGSTHKISGTGQFFISDGVSDGGDTISTGGAWGTSVERGLNPDSSYNHFIAIGKRDVNAIDSPDHDDAVRNQYLGSFGGWTAGPIVGGVPGTAYGYYNAMAFYVNAALSEKKAGLNRVRSGTFEEDIIFTFWGNW